MKAISYPRLDKLTPTLESTSLKLMEESGEFAQLVGKFRKMSGEKGVLSESELAFLMTAELLDVGQTVSTLAYILVDEYNVDLEEVYKQHIEKLKQKCYISEDADKEAINVSR